MYAAEMQGNYEIPVLLNTTVVFGAQYRNDVVSSDRQWLRDRVTKEDISNAQTGHLRADDDARRAAGSTSCSRDGSTIRRTTTSSGAPRRASS